jgi:hypothetical protein
VQQSKARFPPLSLFCSVVFERSLDICERVSNSARQTLTPTSTPSSRALAAAWYDVLSSSALLRGLVPYMVSNLTTLITTGRDWIEELGKQVIALLKCLDTIDAVLNTGVDAADSKLASRAVADALALHADTLIDSKLGTAL